jgi:hypothetical protein
VQFVDGETVQFHGKKSPDDLNGTRITTNTADLTTKGRQAQTVMERGRSGKGGYRRITDKKPFLGTNKIFVCSSNPSRLTGNPPFPPVPRPIAVDFNPPFSF